MLSIRGRARKKIQNNMMHRIEHLDQLWQIWHREAILERVRDCVHN